MKKVGILAGTFDPVHAGHIAFAMAAMGTARLDKVYLLPERAPRGKMAVTSYHHRLKMLELAIAGHPELEVLDLPGKHHSVAETLPILKKRFAGVQMGFLMGSDVASAINNWPEAELLRWHSLIIGLRANDDEASLKQLLGGAKSSAETLFIPSPLPDTASSRIRASGAKQMINQAVVDYAERSGLYNPESSAQSP